MLYLLADGCQRARAASVLLKYTDTKSKKKKKKERENRKKNKKNKKQTVSVVLRCSLVIHNKDSED